MMKQKINKSIKVIICILIGFIISISTIGTYAATLVAAPNVTYTGNGQSTVQGALDTLYTKDSKSVIKIEGNLDYTWDGAGSCGAFKADDSSYVGIIKDNGFTSCIMRYDLGQTITNSARVYVLFGTNSVITKYALHHTGGDNSYYYMNYLVISNIYKEGAYGGYYDIPHIYSEDGNDSYSMVDYFTWIDGQYLYIKFKRDGAKASTRNIQLRGLPYVWANIIL